MVNSWTDNRRLLDLLSRKWPKPVIVTGMGDIGQITRVIGPVAWKLSDVRRSGDECLGARPTDAREMQNVYRSRRDQAVNEADRHRRISSGALVVAEHSQSRVRGLNLDFVYLKFPTPGCKGLLRKCAGDWHQRIFRDDSTQDRRHSVSR